MPVMSGCQVEIAGTNGSVVALLIALGDALRANQFPRVVAEGAIRAGYETKEGEATINLKELYLKAFLDALDN